MKHQILRIASVFVSIVTVFSLIPAHTANAAPSNIYFSPGSGTYNTGTSFTTQVRGSSDAVFYQNGTTSGTINFPANRLRVNSVSTSGSSYPNINVTFNNTAGTISWNGSAYPSPTTIYFFTINFQALSAGTASVTFSADTNVNHNWFYDINSTNKTNANFTLVTPPPPTCPAGQVGTPPNCTTPPPPTCPAGQVGTPPNCTTPPPSGGNPTPTPTPKPTTPTVSDTPVPTPTAQPDVAPVQVDAGDLSIKDVIAKVTRQANSVAWATTLGNVTTDIALGTSKENLTVKPAVAKQPDGSYLSTMENLKPGVRYYFTITATAANAPEKKATFSGAFTTRGYPVKLVVTKDGKKISGATIALEKQSFKTDKNGELELELTDTTFNATITLPDKSKKTVNFTVAKKTIPSNGGNPETQTFTFDLTEQKTSATTGSSPVLGPIIGGIAALAALAIGGGIFLLYRRRKADEGAAQIDTASAYSWEQGSNPPAEATTTMAYAPPAEQQASNLASIEQQYIPETEPQPEVVYEAQTLPSNQEANVLPEQAEPQPEAISENPEPIEYAAQPIEVAPMEAAEEQPIQNEIEQLGANEQDSAEEASANEEEAVYHPDTGELDIIHSHETATPAQNMPPEASDMPQPVADIAPETVEAANLPLPPAPDEAIISPMAETENQPPQERPAV